MLREKVGSETPKTGYYNVMLLGSELRMSAVQAYESIFMSEGGIQQAK